MSTSVDTVRCSLAPGMLAPIMMWRGRVTEVLCQWMDFHGRCCNQHTDQPSTWEIHPDGTWERVA